MIVTKLTSRLLGVRIQAYLSLELELLIVILFRHCGLQHLMMFWCLELTQGGRLLQKFDLLWCCFLFGDFRGHFQLIAYIIFRHTRDCTKMPRAQHIQ